jgi:hypothetical protein
MERGARSGLKSPLLKECGVILRAILSERDY